MSNDENWNFTPLREFIKSNNVIINEKNNNIEYSNHLLNTINSVDKYIMFFRYHNHEIMQIIANWNSIEQDSERFKLIIGIHDNQAQFKIARISAHAHFIASVNCVRNLYDIFAQLANGLILDIPIPIDKCDIHKIAKSNIPHTLKDEITRLTDSYWFQYTEAFSNTIKHRIIVELNYRIRPNEDRFEPYIFKFLYRDKAYDECYITDALEGIVDTQNKILACGNVLNREILSRQT